MTPLQDATEVAAFTDLIKEEGCRSYLEIGAKFGTTLDWVASVMPSGSRVVAVDLPGGTKAWKDSKRSLEEVVGKLRARDYDAQIIWGDSTSEEVIEKVRKLAPFDAIFIDANHTYPYVFQDWMNYRYMGRIIAFHDIAWHRQPDWVGVRIDVPQLWNEIKGGYRHQEFKFCPTRKNNGIGVLWLS